MRVDVLIVTPNFNFGGAEKVSINIANLLANSDIKTEILTLDASGPLKPLISKKVSVSETESKRSKNSFVEIARIIKSKNPRIVLSNTVRMNLSVLLGRLLFKNKDTVYICREPNDPNMTHNRHNVFFKALFKFLYRTADLIVAQNEKMKIDVSEFYSVELSKINVLNNPVVVEYNEIVKQEDDGFIIFVGRLTEQKNIFSLLEAYKLAVCKYNIRQKLYIFGEGELFNDVNKYLLDNKLEAKVKVFPPVLNIYDYIAQARCLVLPSLWEGSPNVVFESLSCSTPVILSPILEQYHEIITSPVHGVILDKGISSTEFLIQLAEAMIFYGTLDKKKFDIKFRQNEDVLTSFNLLLDK